MAKEAPCEETGRGCDWIFCCEICNDLYCMFCTRYRDYDLEEYEEDEEQDRRPGLIDDRSLVLTDDTEEG